MTDLTLAQRLRVSAALHDAIRLTMDRETAHWLIRVLEERDRVAEADKWVHGLLADREEWFARRMKLVDDALVGCAWIGASVVGLHGLILLMMGWMG